uniref:Transcription factor IIIA n=1 Tax=Poecilia formosa TaxID=48698 RepID=A0A087XPV2_POEFO
FCSFSDCSATFRKSWKLEAHLCKHTGLKPFSCESCEKSFCSRYELTRHERVHSGEKPHKCPMDGCLEAFGKNATMNNHVARVRQHQEDGYKCDYEGCEKDFSKKKQLKAHKCEHGEPLGFQPTFFSLHKSFSYSCTFNGCGKDFRSRFSEKTVCEKCNKLFNNTWFLRLHELCAHSGEKRYFLCPRDGCDRKFTRRVKLESHVLGDHEGKKPFSCAYAGCGKSFALMQESLWRHGVVHNPAERKLKKRKPKKDKPLAGCTGGH